jgi:translocation and assembly module TamA
VNPATAVDPDGRIPVTIDLAERAHRTIKPGIGYTTDEGVRGKIAWEHKNAFRRGEKFELAAEASEITSEVEATFRKEEVLLPNQALIAKVRLAEDRPDAYTSRNVSASLFLERSLTEEIIAGGGVTVKESKTKQLGDTERYGLLSFPLYWKKDTSDNLLDPHEGWRLFIKGTPYLELHGNETAFFKGYAYHTRYERIMKKPLLVLALRSAVGFTIVDDEDDVPPDERYYAGGGNSIRGFEFQSVGPREKNDPIGGGSMVEFTAETRWYLTEGIGAVVFIDGGSAFSSELPDFGETIRWGAGFGLRYLTRAGPVRADIAFPVNRRDDDDSFQIYISFGQAF